MMKKVLWTAGVSLGLVLASISGANAQIEIVTGLLKRVIMAMDLKVQKEQTRTILLQDAQKQLENFMQETRLADITDWVQQQKDLYDEYYQELWQVKNALKYYPAVKGLVDKQARLIAGYKQAYGALTRDRHFSVEEVSEISRVYQGILHQSASIVGELDIVINAFSTQMEDGDRLRIINELSASIDRNYRQLQTYTQRNILLSLQRAKDKQDINMIKSLYGIQ